MVATGMALSQRFSRNNRALKPVFPHIAQFICRATNPVPISAPHPQISIRIDPRRRALSRARHNPRTSAVNACRVRILRPAHPNPTAIAVLPKIIQIFERSIRSNPKSAQHPEISLPVFPCHAVHSCAQHIIRARHAHHAIRTELCLHRRPGHPRPLPVRIFPQIIQLTLGYVLIVANPAKQPEISVRVRPRVSVSARAWQIRRVRHTLRPINSRLVAQIRSAHPSPFALAVFPHVILLELPARILACPAKHPQIPRCVYPAIRAGARRWHIQTSPFAATHEAAIFRPLGIFPGAATPTVP